jgi:acyl dehydratase
MSVKQFEFGLSYNEFNVGDVYLHANGKTVFESDNNLFSLLTMNHHPVHTNEHYCEKHQHGKILVVGTYVLSLIVGLSVPQISGKAVANLEYSSVKHLSPVFIGDTLYAKSVVLQKAATSSGRKGIVEVETFGYNQNDVDVLSLRRKILLELV